MFAVFSRAGTSTRPVFIPRGADPECRLCCAAAGSRAP